jgi:hypothetical protein
VNTFKLLTPALIAGSLAVVGMSGAFAQVETTTVKTTTITSSPYTLPSGVTYTVIDPLTGTSKGVYDPLNKATFTAAPGLVILDQNNQAVATFDGGGQVIALTSAPVLDPLLVSIDTRRGEFDTVIKSIRTGGTYDEATISGLMSDLDRVNAQYTAYRSSGRALTYAEELSLAVQLNALGDRLAPFSKTTVFTPLIGARFVSTDGTLVMVDSLGGRNLAMQKRIDAEYAGGRLTNNQVARLKKDLNEITTMQARYTKGGVLKDSKKKYVTEKLDRTQTELDKDIASTNEKRAKIGIKVN